MKEFAKLFQAPDVGQVLITTESGDEGPELVIAFAIPNLGRCSVKLGFPDSSEGWDLAYKGLQELTEEQALKVVREQLETSPFNCLNGLVND